MAQPRSKRVVTEQSLIDGPAAVLLDGSYASLDETGKVPASQLPAPSGGGGGGFNDAQAQADLDGALNWSDSSVPAQVNIWQKIAARLNTVYSAITSLSQTVTSLGQDVTSIGQDVTTLEQGVTVLGQDVTALAQSTPATARTAVQDEITVQGTVSRNTLDNIFAHRNSDGRLVLGSEIVAPRWVVISNADYAALPSAAKNDLTTAYIVKG